MFDINKFKIQVKDWIRNNPEGSEADLTDYCEDLIPLTKYPSHSWIVEQTVGWYRHILQNRKSQGDNSLFDCD